METPIGYLPYPFDIDMTGLNLAHGAMEKLLNVEKSEWLEEMKGVNKFFGDFGKDLPSELWEEYRNLIERLKKYDK
jgi:phosphoenolpyruvate carboxykinase (GTP)